ncbi:MAG: cytochrome c peroxidase [Pseudomonadota bacterium]
MASAEVILTPEEIAQTLRHGPWPPPGALDPSNRVSGDARAVALGRSLFGDPVLSRNGDLACTSCHDPNRDFTDGLDRAVGQHRLDRNTQALWNLSGLRWFGWSGDTDNLWAQSLTPILNPDEHGHSEASLQRALSESSYKSAYEDLFGPVADETPDATAVHIAKALAAYLETLATGRTSFDRFRDALEQNDMAMAEAYPLAAQRGLRIFLGVGKCAFCHSGPRFSNGEFHDAGVPYFVEPGRVDPGRAAGLDALAQSPYTLGGAYSDDPSKAGGWAAQSVRFHHSNFGMFRVPTLRRVAHTAPYMHDGSLPDLGAVVDHYNTIDLERMHADGEAILRPLGLSPADRDDLLAFLMTLSDDTVVRPD